MTLEDELDELLARRPIPVSEILGRIALAARCRSPEDMSAVLQVSQMEELFDEILAVPALAALPAWGKVGLAEIRRALFDGLHSADAQRILLTLAAGDSLLAIPAMQVPLDWFEQCELNTTPELTVEAALILRELMQSQLTDRSLREKLIRNVSYELMFAPLQPQGHPTADYFFSLFTDTQLQLNPELIRDFSVLLDAEDGHEEVIQQFLFAHPIFLDPLAIEIHSKHELGSEFVTDFVLKRINNEYVLVEIERSADRLFTHKGALHSELMDAVGQVRDFQAWILDNIAYARSRLPGIRRPDGLVIIGRRATLSPEMLVRLDEENYSRRGHIKIITFDDLLEQARAIYENLISRPLRIKGKRLLD